MPDESIRFEGFELDLRSGELRRGQDVTLLQEKPLQLLTALLEKPGQVILREELQERLWGGDTFVDFDNNLNATVKKLRQILHDSATQPRYVETLPRKGYRFIGQVSSQPQGAPPSAAPSPWLGWLARGAAAAAIVVAVLAIYFWPPAAPARTAATADKVILAVLPFENLSQDARQDYFSDGLTEELITHLGRLDPRRLGVIARLSAMTYKGTQKNLQQIAQELKADFVLQGSLRRSASQVRISVQLASSRDGTQLWAESYDFEVGEIFDIQSELAERVATSLAIRLLPGEPDLRARAATTSTQAFESYLQGRYFWNQFNFEGYQKAIQHFEKAVAADSNYAVAWAGLADAHNLMAFTGQADRAESFSQAKNAAGKSLQGDSGLAEGYNSLAFAVLYSEWDFQEAQRLFAKAVQLSPGYAMAYHWQTAVLSATGQHTQAIASMERSLELDPVSLSVISDLGWYYIYADRFAEAEQVCRSALEKSPGHGWAGACLQKALDKLGRHAELLSMIRARLSPESLSAQQLKTVENSDPSQALLFLNRIELDRALAGSDSPDSLHPLSMARLHALQGNREEGLNWLEKAYEQRDPWIIFVQVDPDFDALHEDARFDDICRRIGLPLQPSNLQAAQTRPAFSK
ncbi:MAG: winged helix-turn-helix domain-containing protein [Acidobacteriota bacterium]